MTGRILFVCTGNVCRSPFLAHALAARSPRGAALFSSAGTHALVGHPASDRIVAQLRRRGIDARGHRSRQLNEDDLDRPQLILTADRGQRQLLALRRPAAADRIFTARQLVRLLESAPPGVSGDLDDVLTRARAARGRAGASTQDDDISDPWRRSRRVYAEAVAVMDEVVDRLADHLVPTG